MALIQNNRTCRFLIPVRREDIGRATIIGLVIALGVYPCVSLLPFGVMNQPELAGLPSSASMANVLEQVVGPWGPVLVRIGRVISVAGAFRRWTLFAAEIPYRAGKEGMLPQVFATKNANGSPAGSLWITKICVQTFLIVTFCSNTTDLALFSIVSTAILGPCLLSGAYAFNLALSGESSGGGEGRGRDMVTGALAAIHGAWLFHAAGPNDLLMYAILSAAGVPVFFGTGGEGHGGGRWPYDGQA